MIKITVASSALKEIPYIDKKDGSKKLLRLQTAYAHTVDSMGVPGMYPEKFELFAPREGAYPAGEYQLSPSVLQVFNGRLVIGELKFLPIVRTPKAA